jgi:D-serine deaminase-like pyridoxal phosphate-dependent protein
VLTPALAIDLDAVEHNLDRMLELLGGPERWRPHVKTSKFASVIELLLARGVRRLKCANTRELQLLCELGAEDVLLAHHPQGANADRVEALIAAHPGTAISVLVDTEAAAERWAGRCFVDLDTGMGRTGVPLADAPRIRALAAAARGLHAYDGHLGALPEPERSARATAGLDAIAALAQDGQEIVTGATPTLPAHLAYAGMPARHTLGPGTVVFNDSRSGLDGGRHAATVRTRVISRRPGSITVDAGFKAVCDEDLTTTRSLSHPRLRPVARTEEHLVLEGADLAVGELVTLLPDHICPTVNLYAAAVLTRGEAIVGVDRRTARGHEQLSR